MSDSKQDLVTKARTLARVVLQNPNLLTTAGLPNGVRVQTNVSTTTRFPLPLTIGAAVLGAIGVIAAVKGHKIVGYGFVAIGVAGIGAAAAAPELNAALLKAGAP